LNHHLQADGTELFLLSAWPWSITHLLRSYEITFFGKKTPATGTDWDDFLQENVCSCVTILYKLLAPAAKWAQNDGEKRISELFVTKTMHRFTNFPAADFLEIWTQNVKWCLVNSFGTD